MPNYAHCPGLHPAEAEGGKGGQGKGEQAAGKGKGDFLTISLCVRVCLWSVYVCWFVRVCFNVALYLVELY